MLSFLPDGKDKSATQFPVVTCALIFVNIAAYFWALSLGESAMGAMGLIPAQPTLSGIIASMFMHGNLIHLAWNMLFLGLVGPRVEYALGRLEYAIFYFGSGFAAALLHIVVSQTLTSEAANIPMIGASGAIAGILGIFAIRYYKTRIQVWYFVLIAMISVAESFGWGYITLAICIILIPALIFTCWRRFDISALIVLGFWFFQQIAYGIRGLLEPQSGGVAYWSHIGGMLFGMALAYALKMGLEGTKEYLITDARTNLEQGTTADAAENLRTVLEHDPGNADIHSELAGTYVMQNDRDSAIAHYQRSIVLLLSKGDREKAVAHYAELKHHYKDARLDLKSEYQLSRYMVEAGYHAPALQLMQDIAQTHPGTPEAEVALMKAGDLHLNTFADYQSALKCYNRFLAEYPHSSYRAMVEKSLDQARQKL